MGKDAEIRAAEDEAEERADEAAEEKEEAEEEAENAAEDEERAKKAAEPVPCVDNTNNGGGYGSSSSSSSSSSGYLQKGDSASHAVGAEATDDYHDSIIAGGAQSQAGNSGAEAAQATDDYHASSTDNEVHPDVGYGSQTPNMASAGRPLTNGYVAIDRASAPAGGVGVGYSDSNTVTQPETAIAAA